MIPTDYGFQAGVGEGNVGVVTRSGATRSMTNEATGGQYRLETAIDEHNVKTHCVFGMYHLTTKTEAHRTRYSFIVTMSRERIAMTWKHNIETYNKDYGVLAHHLGRVMLNCAGLELLTYSYAATLSSRDVFGTGIGGRRFDERQKHVQQLLLFAEIEDSLRQYAVDLWDEATEIVGHRNLLAHSPITLVTVKDGNGEDSRVVAVVDMEKTKGRESVRYLDAERIITVASSAQALCAKLDACRAQIEAQLASESE